MAEFSEVMRQWKRMCNYYTERADNEHDACAICKFEGDGSNCLAVYEESEPDTEEVERVVMSWAAEHPEPVYPTWVEWLKSMGVVPYMTGLVVTRGADNGHFHDGRVNITAKALEAIPADIAEKLGIQPKEG